MWKKLSAWTGEIHKGCGCASTSPRVAGPDTAVAIGFGVAQIQKDGQIIFDEMIAEKSGDEENHYLSEFELLATADPDHDWRLILYGPLNGRVYQRQEGQWVLVESNRGFA